MAKAKKDEDRVFESDPRAVVHLRAQRNRKRLGLIFGSGASKDLAFPDWIELVERIAAHADVDAKDLLERCRLENTGASSVTRSLAAVTQLLFSEFWQRRIAAENLVEPLTFLDEQKIRSEWLTIIHTELYKDCSPEERSAKLQAHPYLQDLRAIIKDSPLTVTYNFDDSLEKLLINSRSGDEASKTRGYEVTDRPDRQFQKDSAIIYHPNGYLPSTFSDGASAQVVFSDDAFQDQLISAATGRYVHLSNHLFRNTCLLIGLSLDDATLQNLLRQNAVNNPGNIHYIVHFVSDGQKIDDDVKKSIFNANFHSYSLYTLFLTKNEISALAKLITLANETFELEYSNKKPKFVYYIVGSIGAGKSTAAANFRNLLTYDEWIDERKAALALPESEVPDEVTEIDEWVAEQFRKKNYALAKSCEGIHLVDRCPLDPLTFGDKSNRSAKAKSLVDNITDTGTRSIEPGHIIHLECDIEQMRIRNSFKHKYWTDSQYQELIDSIEDVYGNIEEVTNICTRGRNAPAVAREISKVIFLSEYRPINIEQHLRGFVVKSSPDDSTI